MSNLGAVILKEVAKEDVHYDQQAISTLETCLDVDVSRLAASPGQWSGKSVASGKYERHGRAESPDLDKTWASRRNRRPSLS